MTQTNNPFSKLASMRTLDISTAENLNTIYERLLDMPMDTEQEVDEFLEQRDVMEKHTTTEFAESYFLTTIDVTDKESKAREENLHQVLAPIISKYNDKLNDKLMKSELIKNRPAPFDILRRDISSEQDLFCEENIEVFKKMNTLDQSIQDIQGKLNADWKGEKVPLPHLDEFHESTNRETRKEALESLLNAKMSVHKDISQQYDELLNHRHELSQNAGTKNYTDYVFKSNKRFDWTPEDCFDFHAAVREHILPLQDKIYERRKENLGVETLRPYDMRVDIESRAPLKIYEPTDAKALIDGAGKIVKSIDSELYGFFCDLRDNNLMDLISRKNKAPGGYMNMYPVYEKASIFNNGAGLAYDLMVLLHELGHCFHYYLGKDVKPYQLQNWTSEVAEAGSMSMEFMGLEHMQEYLPKDQCQRIKEDRLYTVVSLFTGAAKVDEFQHWVYANPGHTPEQREAKFIELHKIYTRGVDLTGYGDQIGKTNWQFVHVLAMPYYYIDYAISDLLAMTIWSRYKKDPIDGLKHYKQGCALAASKSVPETYKVFGTELDFSGKVIGPLAEMLASELDLN